MFSLVNWPPVQYVGFLSYPWILRIECKNCLSVVSRFLPLSLFNVHDSYVGMCGLGDSLYSFTIPAYSIQYLLNAVWILKNKNGISAVQ